MLLFVYTSFTFSLFSLTFSSKHLLAEKTASGLFFPPPYTHSPLEPSHRTTVLKISHTTKNRKTVLLFC